MKFLIALFTFITLNIGTVSAQDKSFDELFDEWTNDTVVLDDPEHANWLHIVTASNKASYYMRPQDVINVTATKPRVWIKVDHSKDTSATYRRARMLIRFDCINDGLTVLSHTRYMPDGSIHSSEKPNAFEYIAPETIAESWAKNACPKS